MPPRNLSRHVYSQGVRDSTGALVLTTPEPFRYVALDDNEFYTVNRGDTLFSIAGRKYRVIDPDRASGLWWIVADFQPDPIHDPTVSLDHGRVLVLPSVRTVIERIFNEQRRITGT